MPRVNIWIRKDDWEDWRIIGNKSEFIHDAIQKKVEESIDWSKARVTKFPNLRMSSPEDLSKIDPSYASLEDTA